MNWDILNSYFEMKGNHDLGCIWNYPLSCWTQIYPEFANSVDSDQLASEEANWSGSALFAIKYEFIATIWIK